MGTFAQPGPFGRMGALRRSVMVKLRTDDALVRAEQVRQQLKVNIAVSERLIDEADERLERSRALIARGPGDPIDDEPQQHA